MSPLAIAREQIKFARSYTLSLLEDVAFDMWFSVPAGCSTHIGWQVGHLAMAEYGLCLFRQRGRADVDASLMSSSFRKMFSKGSQPELEPSRNPPPEEIKAVLDRVHEQALSEMATFDDSLLSQLVDMPYAATPTKLGALFFCSHHEMIHAGQIGLIRRCLGKQPVR